MSQWNTKGRCIVLSLIAVLTLPGGASAAIERIYTIGHSHIDLAWKWNYAEALQVCRSTFGDVMDLMDSYDNGQSSYNPAFYAQSQAQAYEWMETTYPEVFQRIAYWVERGQWEPVGGMWVESDTNLPSGESLVRQVLYGKLYFLEHLGVDVRVGWLPDTFGYSAGLPQILKKAGIDYLACSKLTWNDTHPPSTHVFYWCSADGSRVLTYLSPGSYDDIPTVPVMNEAIERLSRLQPDITTMLFYIGWGDHGGGFNRIFVGLAEDLERRGYPIVFSRSEPFFRDLESRGVRETIKDELYLEFHRGTYTSRARAKERNRTAEIAMETLEKLASVCRPYGGGLGRQDRDSLWKKILLNQFHDVLPGSAIDLAYRDFDEHHDFIAKRSGDLIESNMRVLCEHVDTSSGPAGEPVVVFNPLSWPRTGLVRLPMSPEEAKDIGVTDEKGQPVPWQFSALDQALLFQARGVPSLGFKTFYLVPHPSGQPAAQLSASPTLLDNAFLTATLDPSTGLLVSLKDKRAGRREAIQTGKGANVLEIYTEGFHPFPAWDLGYDKYTARPRRLEAPLSVELLEAGPVRALVQARYRYLGMDFTQRIGLCEAEPFLRFEFQVDNWGKILNQLLKVSFPLELVNEGKQATYDVPYAALTRTHDGSVANWEASGQKWVNIQNNGTDEQYGVALLSGNKYGFDIANDGPGSGWSDGKANVLRMTLLKSSSQPLPGALGSSFGGPITDKGTFRSSYALYPHAGPWEVSGVVHLAYEFNYPLVCQRTDRHQGPLPAQLSFLEVEPATVVATVLKEPERPVKENELVVRLFETSRTDSEVTVRFPTKRIVAAREVDLLERDLETGRVMAVTSGGLAFEIGHDELVTVRLEYEEAPTAQSPARVESDADRRDQCGCSSLGPASCGHAAAAYNILFWASLVMIPLALRCCRCWKQHRQPSRRPYGRRGRFFFLTGPRNPL